VAIAWQVVSERAELDAVVARLSALLALREQVSASLPPPVSHWTLALVESTSTLLLSAAPAESMQTAQLQLELAK
jgi:hypothetical protein